MTAPSKVSRASHAGVSPAKARRTRKFPVSDGALITRGSSGSSASDGFDLCAELDAADPYPRAGRARRRERRRPGDPHRRQHADRSTGHRRQRSNREHARHNRPATSNPDAHARALPEPYRDHALLTTCSRSAPPSRSRTSTATLTPPRPAPRARAGVVASGPRRLAGDSPRRRPAGDEGRRGVHRR